MNSARLTAQRDRCADLAVKNTRPGRMKVRAGAVLPAAAAFKGRRDMKEWGRL